jgi:phosphatidate cytidylyltransferase
MHFSKLPTEVQFALAGVLAALVLSSVILEVARRLRPNWDATEVKLRLRTWWIIAGLFSLAIVLDFGASLTFFAFVSFLALKEYLSLIPTRRADRRVLFWAYMSIPFQYYWAWERWYGMFIVFIPVYMFLLLPVRMVLLGKPEGYLRAIGSVHWGLMTTVFSLSHAAFLLALEPIAGARVAPSWPNASSTVMPGPGLLIFLVLLTELNDIAQFLWGKSLGRARVVPGISPGKTVAGLVGGVLTTLALAALIGPHLTLMDLPRSCIAGGIIGIAGFAGDVSISALKRDLGIKDSGSILPGHGGILDRIDSLTYTAPLFFHFVYYTYC